MPPRQFSPGIHSGPALASLRPPLPADGAAITALVAACPPLDVNSAYATLLLCSHFAGTCVVAERGGEIMGWVSAYVPPDEPDNLFIWQVAVAEAARGQSLAQRMIEALLARPDLQGKSRLITTVTHDNRASWALFEGVARRLGTKLARTPHFERDAHFAGEHDTEWLATIGPLPGARPEIRI